MTGKITSGSELSLSALDTLMEGCQIIGFDWRYIYLNNTADVHNRRPKEELLGQRYMDMWPGIEETHVFRIIRSTLEDRVPYTLENEFVYPDGTVQWFDLRIQPVPQGVFILSIDITQRKKAEFSLIRHSERLGNLHLFDQAILSTENPLENILTDVLRDTCLLLRAQHASIYVPGPEMAEMELLAANTQGVTEIVPGKRIAEVSGEIIATFTDEGILTINDLQALPDSQKMIQAFLPGEIRSCLALPLFTKKVLLGVMFFGWIRQGKITRENKEIAEEVSRQVTIAIEHDSLRKEARKNAGELQKRVEERTAQLHESMRELEAFSYSVSHDLRAPLRGINGFAQILLEDYAEKLDEGGKRVCAVIMENSMKMGKLIDDLLSFSKIGRSAMLQAPIDMDEMANEVFREISDEVVCRRVTFSVEKVHNIQGDPSMIRQVWTNLLSNAIKFTGKMEKARISVTSRNEDGMCIYSVTDNGAGFDMNYRDKLFGVFERLHNTKDFDGTGVGLAIVHRIIHRHGGEVWAEGAVGKGATFSFSLPVIPDKSRYQPI